jgi:hypothetical protein
MNDGLPVTGLMVREKQNKRVRNTFSNNSQLNIDNL